MTATAGCIGGAIRDDIHDWVVPGYLGSFYDAYHPEARKLFWSQMNDHYMPLGIDAWWMDASEPNIRDCTDLQYRKDLTTPTALSVLLPNISTLTR